MESNTNFELPEFWYDEVKDLFQIKVDDDRLKEDIKPIIVGMSETLSEYNNPVLRQKFAELAADTSLRIAVITDKYEIEREFHTLAITVADIAESTVFVSNRIGNYLSKNSKGKPKQKGSKYF